MALSGYNEQVAGYNSVVKDGVAPNAEYLKAIIPPIGAVVSWMKTFSSADSGTTTSTTANKLVDSAQNFETTIDVGMIVKNTTDDTFAYVTAVDSNTTLSLSSDIMTSGEAYTIYATPYLPDGWVECNGQSLSDSDSPYDGATIPDLNGDSKFLYGDSVSGSTKSEDYLPDHGHSISVDITSNPRLDAVAGATNYSDSQSWVQHSSEGTAWEGYSVVWIMRVK